MSLLFKLGQRKTGKALRKIVENSMKYAAQDGWSFSKKKRKEPYLVRAWSEERWSARIRTCKDVPSHYEPCSEFTVPQRSKTDTVCYCLTQERPDVKVDLASDLVELAFDLSGLLICSAGTLLHMTPGLIEEHLIPRFVARNSIFTFIKPSEEYSFLQFYINVGYDHNSRNVSGKLERGDELPPGINQAYSRVINNITKILGPEPYR